MILQSFSHQPNELVNKSIEWILYNRNIGSKKVDQVAGCLFLETFSGKLKSFWLKNLVGTLTYSRHIFKKQDMSALWIKKCRILFRTIQGNSKMIPA